MITHPFHPLRGRSLRIHDHVTVCNVAMVRYVSDGPVCPVLISIPVFWTSLRRVDDFERVASGRSLFRADDLFALCEMVDSLLVPVGSHDQKIGRFRVDPTSEEHWYIGLFVYVGA